MARHAAAQASVVGTSVLVTVFSVSFASVKCECQNRISFDEEHAKLDVSSEIKKIRKFLDLNPPRLLLSLGLSLKNFLLCQNLS